MFCVNLLRFALSSYVLGNVTFCGPTLLRKYCKFESVRGTNGQWTLRLLQMASSMHPYILYIIYSQDTVIDNIIAILYECEMCAV